MKRIILILFALFALYGCALTPKQMSISTPVIKTDNSAKIVFIRPYNFYGSALPVQIIRVDENKNVYYVGEFYSGYGTIHNVKPGKHIFGISGERWTSLAIDAEANKFYYVRLYVKPGFWAANFGLTPIKSINELKELDKDLKWIFPNNDAKQYIFKRKDKFYRDWMKAVNSNNMIFMQKEYGLKEWIMDVE